MTEPRTKKTTLACDSCRRRKRKCDGKTPICSLCEKGNYECVYDATLDQRRPAQKSYVVALEARVALLEGILKNAGAGDVVGALDLEAIEEDELESQEPIASTSANVVVPTPVGTGPSSAADPETGFVPSDDATNALESFGVSKPEGEDPQNHEEIDLGLGGYEPLISLDAEHKMLAQFWDWQRMHLPYVAPVPFLSAYAIYSEASHPNEPIPPPPPPPPPNPFAGPSAIGVPRAASIERTADLVQFISPLLLDSVFAMAALFLGDSELSIRFYRRAESRVIHEAANPRLATVQAMLIMSTWELGHARAPATWTLLGVAGAFCIKLGMHIDASPLVSRGTMSKRLFETRNFVFWATYNLDRFGGMCMGMHPLIDRRMISTPRHSSLASTSVIEPPRPSDSGASADSTSELPEEKPTASGTAVSWWDPGSLGMGDVIIQAGWEAIRDLIRMTDMLLDGIYAFNAPKRTPQEDLELVTRNNLTIQRFLDDMPTWLRSTGVIKRKENSLVYLHIFTHLTSIIASRPFLSPRPLSEEAMRIDAKNEPSQLTHSSHIIRRYRTLAFRVARASALQITSLVRHIPLSSPCVTLPYAVYSAATILLLAPDDQAAMDGVRTGVACLEAMDESGYWVISAKDATHRIRGLSKRWGVSLDTNKKILGHIAGSGAGGLGGPGGSGGSGASSGRGPSNSDGDSRGGSNDPSSHQASSTPSESTQIHTPTSAGRGGASNSAYNQLAGYSELAPSNQQSEANKRDKSNEENWNKNYSAEAGLNQHLSGPPSYDDTMNSQAYNQPSGYAGAGIMASGIVQQDSSEVYNPASQPQMPGQSYSAGSYTPQPTHSTQPQTTQYQEQGRYQSQPHVQPVQHIHYHFHNHSYEHAAPSQQSYNQPYHPPHVAYALSHSEPQHDLNLPHNHWHEVLPPADPNLPFPLDPAACTDIAVCFADTVRTGQDPAFVQNMNDPYAEVVLDWFSDPQNNFAVVNPEMFSESGGYPMPGGGASMANLGNSGMYAQQTHMGGYGQHYPVSVGGYGHSYGMPGV